MAFRSFYLMCILFYLTTFVHFGTSLNCINYSSKADEEFDISKPISTISSYCDNTKLIKAFPKSQSKYVCVKMLHEDNGEMTITRGCAPEEYCNVVDSVECYTCDLDMCNSSFALLPSIILSIVSGIFATFYF